MLLSLLFVYLVFNGQFVVHSGQAKCIASDEPCFLNDRAADITGARALTAGDILIPPGLSGKGQIIGIADSGLDKGSVSDIHPDLQSEPGRMPKVAMLKSYTDREIPDDPVGHGTHMAATIAGSGEASGGEYQGIAPGASLYFQALLDKQGNLKVPDNLADLFTPAYSAGVRIHVDGWGSGGNVYSSKAAQIDEFVFTHPDFLPIFGAGNSGPAESSLTSEANSKNALVVGSSQVPRPAFSPEARYADQVADSSSRGPAAGGRIKPDLVAPGSAVISACSSLTESNFSGNELYTRMGGTSMAAAVAGGAAALLSEYLEVKESMKNPSSALIKALLINGARSLQGEIYDRGFGILDTAGTVLALENSFFRFVDGETVRQDGSREYQIKVKDSRFPLKVTLAWVDPAPQPGAAAALVNDLDLVVKAPGGKIYYGNDFAGERMPDSNNNVEQVCIDSPQPGEYVIEVQGAGIDEKYRKQAFALVYGQALKTGTVKAVEEDEIELADGACLFSDQLRLINVTGGKEINSADDIKPGSEIYFADDSGYLFAGTWETGGVQLLPAPEGSLAVEMSPRVREGGFYLDSRWLEATGGNILVNGSPSDLGDFPAGAGVKATVNPVLQSLWELKAFFERAEGYIYKVDKENFTITLIPGGDTYRMASWTAGTYSSRLVDSSLQEAPYGYGERAEFDKLMPGMKVSLLLAPGTDTANYVEVERQLVLGKVQEVRAGTGTIVLDSGHSYSLFPGTHVYKDTREAGLEDIAAGDTVCGLLLPDSSELLKLHAYSKVEYGRVVYYSEKDGIIYLIDNKNNFDKYEVGDDIEVFRWGVPVEKSSISPGYWVRLICDPETGEAVRVDIAEIEEETDKVLADYDGERKLLEMKDGSVYRYDSSTLVSKDGYVLYPEDLLPGEKVKITTLESPAPYGSFLAMVAAKQDSAAPVPQLQLTAYSLNGVLIIRGHSSADHVSLYREDGSREVIIPDAGGSFSRIFPLLEGERKVRAVAVDSRTGGINGSEITIKAYPVQKDVDTFTDIEGHRAQEQIEELAARGAVHGYGDGSYRPDQPITRAELVAMIAACKGLEIHSLDGQGCFTDHEDIPWWALNAVEAARKCGIIIGYPDGSFRPYRAVTRAEMAVMLERAFGDSEAGDFLEPLPYRDWGQVPLWAVDSVSRSYQRGFLRLLPADRFEPSTTVTRGEAAILLAAI